MTFFHSLPRKVRRVYHRRVERYVSELRKPDAFNAMRCSFHKGYQDDQRIHAVSFDEAKARAHGSVHVGAFKLGQTLRRVGTYLIE